MSDPDFSKVLATFNDLLLNQRLHPSAQMVVYHRGKKVVDCWGNQPGLPAITPETPFLTFSVSKVFTACAIFKLIDEGALRLDDPVGKYWPEFAQKGKETATIRHTLLHQAGVPSPHLKRQIFLWHNWEAVTRDLARENALYPPGTVTSYHLVNYGFILGEIVRRMTGQSIDAFLGETFFKPMGLNNTTMKMTGERLSSSPREVAISREMKATAFVFNVPAIRSALLPAAGLRSSARELAAFFSMLLNDGSYEGKQYLSKETIRLATRSHYNGMDHSFNFNMNWGLGFIIGDGKYLVENPRDWIMGWGSGNETFAGFGMGTCMVWADRKADLVTAFTCNGMLGVPAVDRRWAVLSNAVWDSLKDI